MKLFQLVDGISPILKWSTVETQGIPPSPRHSASMVYFEFMNILVIYGGRNDASSENPCLNDVCVLNLESLMWCTVTTYGLLNEPRYAHCSALFGE
jgi:hypothetical protein